MKYLGIVAVCFICLAMTVQPAQGKEGDVVIENGKKVAFDYTLTVDNELIDSSQGHAPFRYVHGADQIVPGLEKALEGLVAGDEKTIVVSPDEGYGQPNPAAFQEVPRSSLPPDVEPKIGMFLQGRAADGRIFGAKITELKEENVVVDLNHPLAGKTLTFEIKIVSVE